MIYEYALMYTYNSSSESPTHVRLKRFKKIYYVYKY